MDTSDTDTSVCKCACVRACVRRKHTPPRHPSTGPLTEQTKRRLPVVVAPAAIAEQVGNEMGGEDDVDQAKILSPPDQSDCGVLERQSETSLV